MEAIATSNNKLLGAKGIATRSKNATRAPGLALALKVRPIAPTEACDEANKAYDKLEEQV